MLGYEWKAESHLVLFFSRIRNQNAEMRFDVDSYYVVSRFDYKATTLLPEDSSGMQKKSLRGKGLFLKLI